jgi:hypothetical protein
MGNGPGFRGVFQGNPRGPLPVIGVLPNLVQCGRVTVPALRPEPSCRQDAWKQSEQGWGSHGIPGLGVSDAGAIGIYPSTPLGRFGTASQAGGQMKRERHQ